jgi:hypothetical protein
MLAKRMDVLTRFASDIVGRLHGPLTLRVIIQPLTALVLATRHAVKDARDGNPPHFWTILTSPAERKHRLQGAARPRLDSLPSAASTTERSSPRSATLVALDRTLMAVREDCVVAHLVRVYDLQVLSGAAARSASFSFF